MTEEIPNTQDITNLFTIFTLILIGIAIIFVVFSGYFLYSSIPLETPLIYQNCSNNGNASILTPSSLIFHYCSNEGNTTVLNTINRFFSLSSVSTIYNSYFQNGGLLKLLVSNFTIFVAIIGVFSLYCYFFYNITFNANIISSYPSSEQHNLKIFLQTLFLMLLLLPIYIIFIYISIIHRSNSSIQPIEACLVAVFFIAAMLTSATFYDCDRKIRPFFENRVQFAALQDSKRFLDTLIYFISIIGFVFPLLVILYGTISNFNIFSIIFTISFCFIIIWQINIINNMPRNIFNIKLKDNRNICEGIVLTKLDTEIIQISVQDTINNKKIIHIPRTSIEYISLNRTIKKTDFINPPVSYLQAILSLWNSLKTLKNFLLTFICFDLGFFTGLILFLGVAILTSYLPIPEQLLIIVFLIFSFSFGFFYGRLYTPLIDNVSGKILSLTNFMETSKNFLVTLIDFKLGFLAGSIFFLAIAVFNTDFKELPPQWLTLIIFIIVLIIGFFYGRYHQSSIVVPTLGPVQLSEVVRYPEDIRPPEEMDSENWRSYYAYNDELTNIQYPEEIHPPVDVNSENWRRYYAYNDDLMRK